MLWSVMDNSHSPEEVQALKLLKELQEALSKAINSLNESVPPPSVDSQYLQTRAAFVNQAADGYLVLREAYRVASSKLLVRPALEAVFTAVAVMKKPGFLTRKAASEWKEEYKRFKKQDPVVWETAKRELESFKMVFTQANPGYPTDWSCVDVRETAEAAEMLDVYNTSYRAYCKFTHGALGAVLGELNEITDFKDTEIVINCVMIMLELLKQYTPAQVPNLENSRKRM